jgi:hypothetical protein
VLSLGLTDVPVCGSNAEVLAHHGLDAASIARVVAERVRRPHVGADLRVGPGAGT